MNGGATINAGKFSLYVSDTEKQSIEAGLSWQGTQAPATANTAYGSRQSYPWQSLEFATFSVPTWSPANWQTVALEKHGNQYTLFFNGVQVDAFTATFSSAPKIGFSTYGQVRMDDFKLFSLP